LQGLNRKGVTIFITTHNMEEANQLCDRVAIINHGRIAVIDQPEKLRVMSEELQSIEIAFDRPVEIESLAKLPSVVDEKKMGDKVRLYTQDPNGLINQIVDYARGEGLRFTALNMLTPSLEDVFVKLTKK